MFSQRGDFTPWHKLIRLHTRRTHICNCCNWLSVLPLLFLPKYQWSESSNRTSTKSCYLQFRQRYMTWRYAARFYPVKCTLEVKIFQLVWQLIGWPLIVVQVQTCSGAWSFCYTPITWEFDQGKVIMWWSWPLPFACDEVQKTWSYTLCFTSPYILIILGVFKHMAIFTVHCCIFFTSAVTWPFQAYRSRDAPTV
jgi:hypothetical protein